MCTCGNRGCVAVLATGSAIVRQLGEAGIEVASTTEIVELVNAGDAVAMHHVREAGRVLGAALAGVVSVVAPSVIVIGGELADASEPLIAGIREDVYKHASSLATRELRILPSRLGHRAGVVGVTTLALEHVLEPTNVDALLPGAASRRDPRDPGEPGRGRRPPPSGWRRRGRRGSTRSSCATPRGRGCRACTASRRRRARSCGGWLGRLRPRAAPARALDDLRRQLDGIAALGGQGVITPAAWGMFTRRLPPFDEPPRTPERGPRGAAARGSPSWARTPRRRASCCSSSRSTATRTTWSTRSRRAPS